MTTECITCPGITCMDCGEHVHDWDGWHYCHIAAARKLAAELAEFESGLTRALAVDSGGGCFHAVDCRTVKSHITIARGIRDSGEAAYGDHWSFWKLVHDERVVGYGRQCCSPSVLIQPPPPKRVRLVRRLTGIGWPEDDRCAKGRLPLWTREAK